MWRVGLDDARVCPRQPAIVIQPATRSESLEVHLPKEKWDQRDAIATSLAAIDLPTRLKLESPEYSEFSAKWEEESAKQMAMPSGENMIDVVLMQPRFIATDARDVVTTHCAELLNRDVEQTLAAILNEAVKDWQLEQSLSIR